MTERNVEYRGAGGDAIPISRAIHNIVEAITTSTLPEHLHPLGATDIIVRRANAIATLARAKTALESHRKSVGVPTAASAFPDAPGAISSSTTSGGSGAILTFAAKRQAIQKTMKDTSDMLKKCAIKLQDAIVKSIAAPWGRPFVGKQLDAIARDVGLSCDFDEDNESYLLASSSFYIEFTVDAAGSPKAVKVVHGAEEEEDDQQCLRLLQNGKFDAVATSIERLKDMHRPHVDGSPPTDDGEMTPRFAALLAFEKDLTTIFNFEKTVQLSQYGTTTSAYDLVTRGHGLVRPRAGVQKMSLVYFLATEASKTAAMGCKSADINLQQISDLCTAGGSVAVEGTSMVGTCAHISVFDVDTTGPIAASIRHVHGVAPIASSAPNAETPTSLASLCAVEVPPQQSADTAHAKPFAAVLLLDRPLVCSRDIARRLWQEGGMAGDGDIDAPARGANCDGAGVKGFLPLLLEALSPRAVPIQTFNAYHSTAEQGAQSYHFNTISSQRTSGHCAVLVDRIPFTSADRVHGLLALLRQQSTINSLLYSCAADADAHGERVHVGDTAPVDEATFVADVSLGAAGAAQILLTTQHPVSGLSTVLEVRVPADATITVVIHHHAQDEARTAVLDPVRMAQRLQETLSIPRVIREVWLTARDAGERPDEPPTDTPSSRKRRHSDA